MTIFMSNLSCNTEEETLTDHLNIYREFGKCPIPLDKDSTIKRFLLRIND